MSLNNQNQDQRRGKRINGRGIHDTPTPNTKWASVPGIESRLRPSPGRVSFFADGPLGVSCIKSYVFKPAMTGALFAGELVGAAHARKTRTEKRVVYGPQNGYG